MMLARFAAVSLVALKILAGCGPPERPYDVVGTYTARAYWFDGTFQGEPGMFSLQEDGTVLRRAGPCVRGLELLEGIDWEADEDTVRLFRTEDDSDFARVDLPAQKCGEYRHTYDGSTTSTTYVAGRFCPVDVVDGGHVFDTCSWAPCDEVARQCAATLEDGRPSE